MDIRQRVGVHLRARTGRICTRLALLAMLGGALPQAAAGGPEVRPLDHHAIVLNGTVVGSAFALADGLVVTNAHVVRGLAPGAIVTLLVAGGARAGTPARIEAVSGRMDLAVLAVRPGLLRPVPATDAPATVGLAVRAAGVDASSGRTLPRLELAGEVIVSRNDIAAFGPGLVARLPGVRPGFSGGPMLDRRGRLVGMIAAIRPARRIEAAAGALVNASGFARAGPAQAEADEALVLRATEVRAEVRRLIGY